MTLAVESINILVNIGPKKDRIPHILRMSLKINGKPVAESVAERFFVAES